MPNSTGFFKKQTIEFIKRNFPTDAKILDIGAGSGTWPILMPEYTNFHGIEIFEPYVRDFHLSELYVTITTGNAVEQPAEFFQGYDFIMMGDVIEHMSYEDARTLLDKIPKETTACIGVPWGPQGVHFDNIYEIHIQDKLTNLDFLNLYPDYDVFCLRYDYAVYLNKSTLAADEHLYTIDGEEERQWAEDNYPKRTLIDLTDDPDHMTIILNES